MALQQLDKRPVVGPELSFTVRGLHWSALLIGMLLAANALTFYFAETAMLLSDLICCLLISVLAIIGIVNRAMWMKWPFAVVASWLFFAPLVLKAQSAVGYQNDVLVGSLLIVLFWVLPTMRDRVLDAVEIPPGWTYNPSSWAQRIPLIALALVGFFLSRYLAAYQLGYTGQAWDPWFGGGTEKILTSEVSKAFVVSDAGLGAVSYLIDALAGAIGGSRRWQTMPWMVLLFSVLVIPPGIVSIVLVVLQPVQVGAWCSLCLIAAFNMLIMVPLALDETIATCQYLARAHRNGVSWFHAMIYGAGIYVDRAISPVQMTLRTQGNKCTMKPSALVPPSAVKANPIPPWNLIVSAAIGGWLLALPEVYHLSEQAAVACWIVGALSITFAVSAFAEVCRVVRYLNIPLGVFLASIPVWLSGVSTLATVNLMVMAISLVVLALPKGVIHHQYGSWNRFIR